MRNKNYIKGLKLFDTIPASNVHALLATVQISSYDQGPQLSIIALLGVYSFLVKYFKYLFEN